MQKQTANAAGDSIIGYISKSCKNLPPSYQAISEYIATHTDKVIGASIAEFASSINMSEATVVRYCKRIGFKGFSDFKIKLARFTGEDTNTPIPNGIDHSDPSDIVIRKVLESEYDDIRFTAEMLDMNAMVQCVDYLFTAPHIAFFGIGSSSIVAKNAKEHFLHYGKLVHAEEDTISQLVLANTLGYNDVAFSITVSGESVIPIQALKIAKKNGARTVCLTQSPNSEITKYADCVLIAYRRAPLSDDLGTISRIVHSSIIDALAITYAVRNYEHVNACTRDNRNNYKPLFYRSSK